MSDLEKRKRTNQSAKPTVLKQFNLNDISEVVGKPVTTHTTNHEIKSQTPENIGAFEGPQPMLSMFHIYHCIEKQYMFTDRERQTRKYVGSVMAKDLDDAFRMAQNDFNEDYRKYKVRSTSIGDLIQDDYGFYMITGIGMKLLCLVDNGND